MDDSSVPKIKIRRFDPSTMKKHAVIVMLGKRNTGKTVLVKDIMYHNRDIPAGCVISGSEEANDFYSEMVPSILIKPEFKPDHIKNLIARQRQIIAKNKEGNGPAADPRAFLIMDDCLFDPKWSRDSEIRRVIFNGRHYKITYLLTMQYPLGMPPMLRGNVDYVFILRENVPKNRERIYNSYAGIFPTFDIFQQVLLKVTKDYGALVIDNTVTSNNLYDSVFWYKAEMHGNLKLCCDSLWRLDESYKQQRAKQQKEEGAEPDDEMQLMKKSPRVFVKMLMDGASR